MENDRLESRVEKVDETVNFRDGFTFDFVDAGHNIKARCSSMSGKESVFLDDNLMCEKRSFRRKSSMDFVFSGNKYEVEFNVVDILKGETHCTLIKNDLHIKTIKKALLKKYQLAGRSLWFRLPFYFAFGAFGAVCGYLVVKHLPSMFGG